MQKQDRHLPGEGFIEVKAAAAVAPAPLTPLRCTWLFQGTVPGPAKERTRRMPKKSTPTPTPERLLTIKEVAELERASERTIRRRIDAGELPAIQDGRLVRIRPQDLEAWRRRRLRDG